MTYALYSEALPNDKVASFKVSESSVPFEELSKKLGLSLHGCNPGGVCPALEGETGITYICEYFSLQK